MIRRQLSAIEAESLGRIHARPLPALDQLENRGRDLRSAGSVDERAARGGFLPANKPDGLWYAFGSGWMRQLHYMDDSPTEGEEFERVVHDEPCTLITLAPAARVMRIESADELRAMAREYLSPGRRHAVYETFRLDWGRVAADYDGIEVLRLAHRPGEGADWTLGWDVPSGCIWDPEAIAALTPTTGGAVLAHERAVQTAAERAMHPQCRARRR